MKQIIIVQNIHNVAQQLKQMNKDSNISIDTVRVYQMIFVLQIANHIQYQVYTKQLMEIQHVLQQQNVTSKMFISIENQSMKMNQNVFKLAEKTYIQFIIQQIHSVFKKKIISPLAQILQQKMVSNQIIQFHYQMIL